jgi:hypothetical protein
LALARFAVGRAFAQYERPRAAARAEVDDTLDQIDCARTDERLRRQLREAIEGKTDREVLTFIYADLLKASAMLGETDVAAEIRALGCKAVALLGDQADAAAPGEVPPGEVAPGEVAPDTAATRLEAHVNPDEGPDPDRMTSARRPLQTAGRAPP